MFSADFVLETVFPLAQAAYTGTPPPGWTLDHLICLTDQLQRDLLARLHPDDDRIGTHFGIVAKNETSVAVVFRGTQSQTEWAEDFDVAPIPFQSFPGARVERGFEALFAALHGSCNLSACKNLLVIGHSLGAALAVLFASDATTLGMHPVVYPIACPRVGDIMFANSFNIWVSECYRLVNRADIVPHVPMELFGYRHVGMAIEIDGAHDPLDPKTAHTLASYQDGTQKLKIKLDNKGYPSVGVKSNVGTNR